MKTATILTALAAALAMTPAVAATQEEVYTYNEDPPSWRVEEINNSDKYVLKGGHGLSESHGEEGWIWTTRFSAIGSDERGDAADKYGLTSADGDEGLVFKFQKTMAKDRGTSPNVLIIEKSNGTVRELDEIDYLKFPVDIKTSFDPENRTWTVEVNARYEWWSSRGNFQETYPATTTPTELSQMIYTAEAPDENAGEPAVKIEDGEAVARTGGYGWRNVLSTYGVNLEVSWLGLKSQDHFQPEPPSSWEAKTRFLAPSRGETSP